LCSHSELPSFRFALAASGDHEGQPTYDQRAANDRRHLALLGSGDSEADAISPKRLLLRVRNIDEEGEQPKNDANNAYPKETLHVR